MGGRVGLVVTFPSAIVQQPLLLSVAVCLSGSVGSLQPNSM